MEDLFQKLPNELALEIVRRTSPFDAARLAVISKWLKFVADSDAVWDKFIPSDWTVMVSKSMVYATKKELYMSLCRTPFFPNAGKLGFFVDKMSGKKCYLVVAMELMLPWDIYHPPKWKSHPDSSTEVAVLDAVYTMDIRGRIKVRMLSPHTSYGAYLVYKLPDSSCGLRSLNAVVRLVDKEEDDEAERRAAVVHLIPRVPRSTQFVNATFPVTRDDGWLEIHLGTFYNLPCHHGDQLEARLTEINRCGRGYGTLIIQSIHFRPH